MKWENRDVNVLEQASIPQFSRLDDIGIPLRVLNHSLLTYYVIWLLAIPSCMVDRKSRNREKVDTSLENFSSDISLILTYAFA